MSEEQGFGAAAARVGAELRGIGNDLAELVSLGLDRARLGLREAAFQAFIVGWLLLVAVTATIVAVYFLIDGLSGALTRLGGGRWWVGRAGGGAVVLVVIATLLLAARAAARRRGLSRLRAKYEREEGPSRAPGPSR